MRFDDTLTTIFAQPSASEAARIALWQQVVDQLAQNKRYRPVSEVQRAWRLAHDLRADVPIAARRRLATALAPLCQSAEIVLLFSSDLPSVAAPIITQAQLSSADWLRIVPRLPVPARALLRERRDLPARVRRALQSYGAQDFVLVDFGAKSRAEPVMATPPTEASTVLEDVPPIALSARVLHRFRFVTEARGRIIAAWDAPSPVLVGLDTSRTADPGAAGVDGVAASAFQAQAAYRDAHLYVPGQGPLSGNWLVSGVPHVAEESGRFLGYFGSARRPQRRRHRHGSWGPEADLRPLPDGLRHFLHEVRTPLNAVRGSSEIIAAQLYGPVNTAYRRRADAIAREAGNLSEILEEVQLFGKLGEEDFEPEGLEKMALPALVAEIIADTHRAAGLSHNPLSFRADASLSPFVGDTQLVRHMVRRLFQAVLSVATPQERLETRLVARGSDIVLSVARPVKLQDLDDARLFDPNYASPEADAAANIGPPLGFGFALRLVRALADALGARFELSRPSLSLRFPSHQAVPLA
ncbi:MAG: sensor histidine kinase [Sphingomonadaceae bacterium]|nr:sensor histidine kinase [Sphingomonadaceae bacterium]